MQGESDAFSSRQTPLCRLKFGQHCFGFGFAAAGCAKATAGAATIAVLVDPRTAETLAERRDLEAAAQAVGDVLGVLVQERWFDIVGFSVGSERRFDELARAVDVVRRDSRNRDVGIMLGGPMMSVRPELSLRLGCDLIGRDGSLAPRHARAFMALRQKAEQ